MSSKYHLYPRSRVGKDGKTVRRWYYWYIENGIQVRKAAGQDGSAPLLKRDAQEFIYKLIAKDAAIAAGTFTQQPLPLLPEPINRPAYGSPRTFREFASTLFMPEALHLKRTALTEGKQICEETRKGHRSRLDNYLIPKWGNCRWATFAQESFSDDFVDWLVELNRIPVHKAGTTTPTPAPISNSLRNCLIDTMTISLREAKRTKLLRTVPEIPRFNRKSRHQDTLTDFELAKLFPEDKAQLEKVWRLKDPRDQSTGILFGAMCCLGVSAGLRSGELRGVSVDQIVRKQLPNGNKLYGLIVDKALSSNQEIVGLKKATDDDLRVRVVMLSDKTMRILDLFLESIPPREGLLFLHHGLPIRKETLGKRWAAGLRQAGISTVGRRLTPHSMRYTFNTRMRMLLNEQTLQEAIGHKDDEMTALYDRPHLEERLSQLADQRSAFNKFWDGVNSSALSKIDCN